MAASLTPTTREKLTEDYSCGYCLQRLSYMVDPRELPCSHVFCLPCLQADFRKYKVIECGVCGRSHDKLDLQSLVKVDITADTGETSVPSEEIPACDICEEKQVSICYCGECDQRFCESHQQTHEASLKFLRQTHPMIAIGEYLNNKLKYQTERCPDHKEEKVILACDKCCQMFCLKCQTGSNCAAASAYPASPHTMLNLQTLAQSLREQLKTSMRSLSDKITETCKQEKIAWSSLDDVEVKVKEMTEEVDRVTEDQIREIRKKSLELKVQIEDYLRESIRKVEKYTASLTQSKEEMQSLWSSAHHLVAESRDSEIILRQKKTIAKLEGSAQLEIKPSKPFRSSLVSQKQSRDLEMRFLNRSPPSQITLDLNLPDACYSVTHTKNGTFLSSANSVITTHNSTLNETKSANIAAAVFSPAVAEHPKGYVVFENGRNMDSLSFYTPNLTETQVIDTFASPNSRKFVTVHPSTSHIVAIDLINVQLKCYDENGKFLKAIKITKLSNSTSGIHVLSDDTVLLGDQTRGCVEKYRVTPEPQIIWTCQNITQPHGITSDVNGFIYAAGCGGVFVITEHGELIRKLTHPALGDNSLFDVSVFGDQLAVACGGKGLKTFKMHEEE